MTVVNKIRSTLYIINLKEKKEQLFKAVTGFFNRIKPLWVPKKYA